MFFSRLNITTIINETEEEEEKKPKVNKNASR